MSVLVVDDEKDLLTIIKGTLTENFPTDVHTAENGLDAFILCQKNQYDLIITDHEMPFMTGAGFLVALRTRENMSQHSPVIMLSAYIDKSMKEKLNPQNVEFLSKPYDEDTFVKMVTPYLI